MLLAAGLKRILGTKKTMLPTATLEERFLSMLHGLLEVHVALSLVIDSFHSFPVKHIFICSSKNSNNLNTA